MKNLKQLLIEDAAFYDAQMNEIKLHLYAEQLEKYPPEQIAEAMSHFRKQPSRRQMPMPADLISYFKPEPDSKEIAVDLVRRIDRAIIKHGWNWEDGYFYEDSNYWESSSGKAFLTFKEAVIDELGQIGWHVICARGGWKNVCTSSNEMEEGIYIAQMRDQIQASVSLSRQGIDVAKIEMPKSKPQIEQGLEKATPMLHLIKPKDLKDV